MKYFETASYQILDTGKWAPGGMLFEIINGDKMNIQEADIFPPEFRFDTREESDNFFREYFIQRGYIEK